MYHFLVNPSSCSGRGGRYWELVKKTLKERGISYQVHFSGKAGDMERLAAELTQSRAAQFSAAQFSAAQFSAGQRGSAQGGQ